MYIVVIVCFISVKAKWKVVPVELPPKKSKSNRGDRGTGGRTGAALRCFIELELKSELLLL